MLKICKTWIRNASNSNLKNNNKNIYLKYLNDWFEFPILQWLCGKLLANMASDPIHNLKTRNLAISPKDSSIFLIGKIVTRNL